MNVQVLPMGMMVGTIVGKVAIITKEPMAHQVTIHLRTILTDGSLNRTFMNSRKSAIRTRTANEGNLEVAREDKTC